MAPRRAPPPTASDVWSCSPARPSARRWPPGEDHFVGHGRPDPPVHARGAILVAASTPRCLLLVVPSLRLPTRPSAATVAPRRGYRRFPPRLPTLSSAATDVSRRCCYRRCPLRLAALPPAPTDAPRTHRSALCPPLPPLFPLFSPFLVLFPSLPLTPGPLFRCSLSGWCPHHGGATTRRPAAAPPPVHLPHRRHDGALPAVSRRAPRRGHRVAHRRCRRGRSVVRGRGARAVRGGNPVGRGV